MVLERDHETLRVRYAMNGYVVTASKLQSRKELLALDPYVLCVHVAPECAA